MDFFQAQDAARTRTRTLVALFVAAVAAIIAAVYLLVHATFGPGVDGPIDPALLAAVALGIIALVSIGSTVRTLQLRQGGSRVAELLGGRRVRPSTTDEHERRLVNVVEEMAIASGTPVPAIYVLDDETGINAFAAGYTLDDAAVAVTRGTLHQLTRAELQGVIAHEFSHILNGDMRLNIRLIGLLFGILLLAVLGRGLLHGGRGGRRGGGGRSGGQVAAVGIGLIAIGYIGVFFGRLIQAAVSRQREYLADSSAVQFTRAPEGLAGALQKIAGSVDGSRIANHHAAEASHLFFANGMSSPFATLLATHPPLEDRIRRIDPSFRGRAKSARQPVQEAAAGASFAAAPSATPAAPAAPAAPATVGARDAAALVASVGAPRPEHVAYAHDLLESLPAAVLSAAHEPADAPALLYALWLLDHAGEAPRQVIAGDGGAPVAERADTLAHLLRPLGAAVRLPLVDILLPSLRTLPAAERERVRATTERLIQSDNRVEAFELAVYHILHRQLTDERPPAGSASAGIHSFAPLRSEVELILSAIAWSGAQDAAAARSAFDAGARVLPATLGRVSLAEGSSATPESIDAALGRLRHAAPGVRRRLLEACARIAVHDGGIEVQEGEMLRAVAEALDCPMPPLAARAGVPG